MHDASLADDRKVKEYVNQLHRYLNVGKTPSVAEINWISEPTTPRQPPRRQLETSSSTQPARKKKKGKRKTTTAALPRLQWDQ